MSIVIEAPLAYQVIQRCGFIPGKAHVNNPGGPCFGIGIIEVLGRFEGPRKAEGDIEIKVRCIVTSDDSPGRSIDWQAVKFSADGKQFITALTLAAGGWYRLEIKAGQGGGVLAEASVGPIGVGEVFIVAGQSYASNANDCRMTVAEPQGRIVVFDLKEKVWRIADDPQPETIPSPVSKEEREGDTDRYGHW